MVIQNNVSVQSPVLDPEERKLQARTSDRRFFQLDAMRGIAALCVLFHHTRLAFCDTTPPWWLTPVFSGDQAVALFFVLSGFVLSLPYLAGNRRPYWPYLIRRFWRLYVPYAAAVVLAVVGALCFRGYHLPLSDWYYRTWQTPVTASLVIRSFLVAPLDVLNTAFWSLTVEVELSIVMPFLAILVRRLPAAVSLALLLLWFVSFAAFQRSGWGNYELQLFVQFGPLFLLGSILAKYRAVVDRVLRSLGNGVWLVLIASVLLYCNYHPPTWRTYAFLEFHRPMINGIGAAGLIACALSMPRLTAVLEHRPFEYLGRISYSLYLSHGVVLFAMLDLFYTRLTQPVLILAILAAALLVGHLFCIAIEEPSMRQGKRLAEGAARSRAARGI